MSTRQPVPIAVIGGDGIGPELTGPVSDILESHFNVTATRLDAGYELFRQTGSSVQWTSWEELDAFEGILFGATGSPSSWVAGYKSPILEMREKFELFVNIRPVKSLISENNNLDLVILRENLEGLYARRERMVDDDTAVAEKVVTRDRIERLARFTFEYASGQGHKRVTVVHKANVLKLSDGMFREICLDVAEDFPKIETNETLVDATAFHLVRDPGRFDVVLTMNLYGDILSDIAAGMADGLGFAPSLSVGPKMALAEPVHGSAPDVAGTDVASPYATVFSACMLLDRLGMKDDAETLRTAAENAIAKGSLTPDAGGTCSTSEVLATIEEEITVCLGNR